MVPWQWLLVTFLGGLVTAVMLTPLVAAAAARFRAWRDADEKIPLAFNLIVVALMWAAAVAAVAAAVYMTGTVLQATSPDQLLDNLNKLGPGAAVLAATVALLVGFGTILQKQATDRRDLWWKRTEWALSAAYPDTESAGADARVSAGLIALEYQSDHAPTIGEAQFVKIVIRRDNQGLEDELAQLGVNLDNGDVPSDTGTDDAGGAGHE